MDLFCNIVLWINGKRYEVDVSKVTPNTSLNYYLRDHLYLTGTKKMCLEGGCGSCVVNVNRIDPLTEKLETFAVNSCLISIFSCHGWHIQTVEGIGDQTKPHLLQKRLAEFNGTQCGFCTPGMIMNMYSLSANGKLTMKEVENSFGGNICRCTGYRSILDAFKSTSSDFKDIEDITSCVRSNDKQCCLKFDTGIYFNSSWIKVFTFDELVRMIREFHNESRVSYGFVAGNTAQGVYKEHIQADVYIDIQNVKELINYSITDTGLILGAGITLTGAMRLFNQLSSTQSKFQYLKRVAEHIDLIANVPVRNVGTLAGNLMIKHTHNDFPSDVFLMLETIGALLLIVDINNEEHRVTPEEFLRIDMNDKIIKKIILPALEQNYFYKSYKIMPRAQNAHALVNAGFLFHLSNDYEVKLARIVYGCISDQFIHARETEKFLPGKRLFDNEVLQNAYKKLESELNPNYTLLNPSPEFRKSLAISLFYKCVLNMAPSDKISPRHLSGREELYRSLSSGSQKFNVNENMFPVTQPLEKVEALRQTTGEAEYITDMPDLPRQLYAVFVLTQAPPNAIVKNVETSEALNVEGVKAYFNKNDIPGKNTFTPLGPYTIANEEELFCEGIVRYYNQPIGIIVAETQIIAEKAANLVKITYEKGKVEALCTIRDILEAKAKHKIEHSETIEPKTKGENIAHVFKGTYDMNWQYHFHLELQCCQVVYKEDSLDIYTSTQWMELNQSAVAAVLNIPVNRINIFVKRIGGAFGAKIIRNSMISAAASLASYKLKKPVKMLLSLEHNMRVIGKRSPIASDYEIAVDEEGKIQYLNNTLYEDFGVSKNENLLFLAQAMYLANYDTSTWYTNSNSIYSDTHASVFTRGPGATEGMGMSEAIMEHAALASGIDSLEFKIKNLSKKYPCILDYINDMKIWADIDRRKIEIEKFNHENRWKKKGLSLVPMAYPVYLIFSYEVIISIYRADGSVAISHGGIEIGQGINTKAIQVCAYKLGIPVNKISVKQSNNLVAPNSHSTGASVTTEGVCLGIINCCDILLERIKPVRQAMENPTWEKLIQECYNKNIHLSATSTNSPKNSGVDYVVYAVAASEVELDVLTGKYQINRVDIIEDVGQSMNPKLDIGQIEGAFIMGMGYYTSEEIIMSKEGETLTDRTWTYKPPGVKDIPIDFRIKFANNSIIPAGVLKSKAVGEPAICLSISVPLAIRQAVASIRQENDKSASVWYPINGPSTVENTFDNCLHNYKYYTL